MRLNLSSKSGRARVQVPSRQSGTRVAASSVWNLRIPEHSAKRREFIGLEGARKGVLSPA